MFDEHIKSNQVTIMGEIASPFTFSQKRYGTNFYIADVNVKRFSGAVDRLPVEVSDELVDVTMDYTGEFITVKGQYRSYNCHDGQKSRLILYVFAEELEIEVDWEEPDASKANQVILSGYICKKPVYRETLLGRKITDIILAVNRPVRGTDYIPCIIWGKDAEISAGWEVGSHVRLTGRIQSRKYMKKLSEAESEERTAYEVSVKKMEVI